MRFHRQEEGGGMRSLCALSLLLVLPGCGEQQAQKHDSGIEQPNAASGDIGIDPSLAARLARGEATVCSDPEVHSRVVLQTLGEFDRDAAEKYQLLLSHGEPLKFVESRMTGAQSKTAEVSCSATLPNGFAGKPFSFTYALRPVGTAGEIMVDHKGNTDPWFHFRGTVLSKLAEMGLSEIRRPGIPQVQPVPQAQQVEPVDGSPSAEENEPLPINDELAIPAEDDPPAE